MSDFGSPDPRNDPSSDSWQPPSVYRWQPHPSPYAPAAPPPPRDYGSANRRNQGGLLGGLAAAFYAFLKYGIVLLKVGKLAPTLISMVVALFFYAIFFGWQFGVGLVLLILVHESGHVLVSRWQGLPMSLPVFLGPFGAFTRMKAAPRDARQEAIIAIGGPVFGSLAALACFAWALITPYGHLHFLLLALAYFGFFINLFNLIPMSPLDGGRVATAISKWMNVVGVVIMAAVALLLSNPFAIIILILGVITTVQRFRNAARGLEPAAVPPGTRAAIGAAWLAMLAVCVVGMSLAHTAEINSEFVPGVNQSTNSV
jgi:Zn-dependent protease